MRSSVRLDCPYTEPNADRFAAFIKEAGLEVRFSTEDSFRSNLVDVLSIYSAVDKIGVNRVGIAGKLRADSKSSLFPSPLIWSPPAFEQVQLELTLLARHRGVRKSSSSL